MDFKRNQNYFSQTFSKKMTALAVIGITLAIVSGLLWWYIYLGEVFYYLFQFAAIGGIVMAIAAISLRPSEQYLFEQIEGTQNRFRDQAMEVFGYPADAENSTRLVWGFVSGTVEKVGKDKKTVTDRVEFSMIHLKKGEVRVYRQIVSLLEDSTEVIDTRLARSALTAILDRDAHTLTLADTDETVVLAIHSPDYQLEEWIGEMGRQKGR